MKAKDQHRLKLVEYLGNPSNEFYDRQSMAKKVLGFATESSMYKHFTPDELTEIEQEALALRRKKYSPYLAKIDKAMIEAAAKDKDSRAGKLCYQRFEDWGERKEMSGPGGRPVQFLFVGDDEIDDDDDDI